MNPFRSVADLGHAVFMPFKAIAVVGLCAAINAMTYSGTWWFKWVALGMGIATAVALARGLKALLLLALLAWAGHWVYKRHGDRARALFEAWAEQAQPKAAQVLAVVRSGAFGAR